MKQLILLSLTALFLLCACALATAETGSPLPDEIQTYLTTGNMEGTAILDKADLTGYGADDCWFVLIRSKGGANYLCSFKQLKDGSWKQEFRTSGAVPQTKHDLMVNVQTSGVEWNELHEITRPTLFIGQEDEEGEYWEFCVSFQLAEHQWLLRTIWSYTGYDHMRFDDGGITYCREVDSWDVAGYAQGTIQRDLRYMSLSGIPKTLAEARAKLTVAPSIPASAELKVYPVTFAGARKYEVYSAPDKGSVRANNGKALVSTNSWIQVFGTEGDWVLVQYSIDASHYRFGYISKSSLPKKTIVPELAFHPALVWMAEGVTVTDDPLYSRAALLSLPEGTQATLLATLGEWAYIDYYENDHARGFVPVSSVQYQREFKLRNQPDDNGRPVFEGTLTLTGDDRMEGNIGIAQDGCLGNAAVSQIRILDSGSMDALAVFDKADDGKFYGAFGRGGDVFSIILEALDTNGKVLASIRMDW